MNRGSVLVLLAAGALGGVVGCRAIIGVEELRDDPSADAGADATKDASSSADGAPPAALCTASSPGGCERCCRDALPAAFAALLRASGRLADCACGAPATTPPPCAPACAGNQTVCPGSPPPPDGGGAAPDACETCVLTRALSDPACIKAQNTCAADPECAPIAACLSGCQ